MGFDSNHNYERGEGGTEGIVKGEGVAKDRSRGLTTMDPMQQYT